MQRENLSENMFASPESPPVRWRIARSLVDYPPAVETMEREAAAIAAGTADELVWLVEHPPLYTAGTSADATDLVMPDRLPVFATGRGGEYTYHGPGQRVVYVMLDLKRRRQDVRAFVAALESVIIATLDSMNIKGERREDRVGVWVRRPEKPPLIDGSMVEDKVAAIGIRLRRWVSFHGFSLNVDPDLDHPRLWRDEPRRPRPARHDDRRRYPPQGSLRNGLRSDAYRQWLGRLAGRISDIDVEPSGRRIQRRPCGSIPPNRRRRAAIDRVFDA
jgi:lipoyl(octanoyl) transferase